MSTSSLGHYTRYDESLCRDEDPTDTGLAYRAINNLNHLSDQYAQVRVAWKVKSGAQGLELDPSGDTLSTSTYTYIYRSSAFDMHVRGDGTSYPCVGRIWAHSGDAAYAATFRAGLVPSAPGREYSAAEIEANDVNVSFASVTGTGFTAWTGLNELIYLDSSMVGRSQMLVATVDDIGGATVFVRTLSVRLFIYVSGDPAHCAPELGGVELYEYLEP